MELLLVQRGYLQHNASGGSGELLLGYLQKAAITSCCTTAREFFDALSESFAQQKVQLFYRNPSVTTKLSQGV